MSVGVPQTVSESSTKDAINDIIRNLKIDRELKLKTTPILLLQSVRLAAAPCNVVLVFTENECIFYLFFFAAVAAQPQLQIIVNTTLPARYMLYAPRCS